MDFDFPPWSGERTPLAAARKSGHGIVAGRYQRGTTRDILEDASAAVAITHGEARNGDSRPGHGDQVAGTLVADGDNRFRLEEVRILAIAQRELPAELRQLASRRPCLELRERVLSTIRGHFTGSGFLEVETPSRVVNPGLEPHLRPFAAGSAPDDAPRFLATSPELSLKKMLAAGYEKIFEVARAFRDDERGAHHNSEFTLLEWYRTHAGLDDLATDVEHLLGKLAAITPTVRGTDLGKRPLRMSFREVFQEHAGSDPSKLQPDERERLFVEAVEPRLGVDRPLLIDEFPPDAAALARLVAPRSAGGWDRVAARMELYIAGVELANGFDELNDPAEQRRRHEADRAAHDASGRQPPPLDEDFLAALEAGMPPAAGMALGVDRLVMLLADADTIADVRTFSD